MKYPLFERLACIFLNIRTLGWYRYVQRGTHVEMIITYTKVHCCASYSDFKAAFDKVKREPDFKYWSLFHRQSNSQFHADIIEINGIGYMLSTYGLRKATKMKDKLLRQMKERAIKDKTVTTPKP